MRHISNEHSRGEVLLAGVIAFALLTGCCSQRATRDKGDEFFVPESQVRDIDMADMASTATGARADGTLYAAHFDGPDLNSLGQQKLSLMTRDLPTSRPVVVYMATPATDPMAQDRRAAVQKFLQDFGYAASRIDLRDGPNPGSYSPSAAGLSRMPKTESGAATPGPVGGSDSSNGSSASGSSGATSGK